MDTYNTRNITSSDANSTVVIRTTGGVGEFGYMTVLADSAHTITFYDGVDTTGDLIFTKPASMDKGTYKIKRFLKKGLCAVVQASFAGNIVISYK